MEDKKLLEIYMIGFNDELDSLDKKDFNDDLSNKAYRLGRIDAIIGDDVMSLNYRSGEEILKEIKE